MAVPSPSARLAVTLELVFPIESRSALPDPLSPEPPDSPDEPPDVLFVPESTADTILNLIVLFSWRFAICIPNATLSVLVVLIDARSSVASNCPAFSRLIHTSLLDHDGPYDTNGITPELSPLSSVKSSTAYVILSVLYPASAIAFIEPSSLGGENLISALGFLL